MGSAFCCKHYSDKREAGAEVAGYPTSYHDKENEGANAGEKNCGVGIKAHNDGGKHGCPKHGQHVLQADKYGLSPGKPFVRRDDAFALGGPAGEVAPSFSCLSCHVLTSLTTWNKG